MVISATTRAAARIAARSKAGARKVVRKRVVKPRVKKPVVKNTVAVNKAKAIAAVKRIKVHDRQGLILAVVSSKNARSEAARIATRSKAGGSNRFQHLPAKRTAAIREIRRMKIDSNQRIIVSKGPTKARILRMGTGWGVVEPSPAVKKPVVQKGRAEAMNRLGLLLHMVDTIPPKELLTKGIKPSRLTDGRRAVGGRPDPFGGLPFLLGKQAKAKKPVSKKKKKRGGK